MTAHAQTHDFEGMSARLAPPWFRQIETTYPGVRWRVETNIFIDGLTLIAGFANETVSHAEIAPNFLYNTHDPAQVSTAMQDCAECLVVAWAAGCIPPPPKYMLRWSQQGG